MNVLLERWTGFGAPVKERYTLADRLLAFVDIGRPVVSVMSVVGVGGAAALAYGGIPSLGLILIGALSVLLAVWSVHTLNDYIHRGEDSYIWPRRPIPSGRITPRQGLFFGIACYAGALALSWFFFSQTDKSNFIILFLGLGAVLFYSAYARDRVGYLSLPFLIGLFTLGGWTAFSPQTLFTSPIPWLLYALHFSWQASHIMVHSAAHHPRVLERKGETQKPAFFYPVSLNTAVTLAALFLALFIVLAILLFFVAGLGIVYLVGVLASCAFAAGSVFAFLKDPTRREVGSQAFFRLTLLRLGFSGAILLNYLVWAIR